MNLATADRLEEQKNGTAAAVRLAQAEIRALASEVLDLLGGPTPAASLKPVEDLLAKTILAASKTAGEFAGAAEAIQEAINDARRADALAKEKAEAERQMRLDMPVRHEGGRGPDLVCVHCQEDVDSVNTIGLCTPCLRAFDAAKTEGNAVMLALLKEYEDAAVARAQAADTTSPEPRAADGVAPADPGLPAPAETCPECGGKRELFQHVETCRNDDCALAGGPGDCVGEVVPCATCGPDPVSAAEIPAEQLGAMQMADLVTEAEGGAVLEQLDDAAMRDELTADAEAVVAAAAADEAGDGAPSSVEPPVDEEEDHGPPRVLGERVRLPHEEGGTELPAGARRGRRR